MTGAMHVLNYWEQTKIHPNGPFQFSYMHVDLEISDHPRCALTIAVTSCMNVSSMHAAAACNGSLGLHDPILMEVQSFG